MEQIWGRAEEFGQSQWHHLEVTDSVYTVHLLCDLDITRQHRSIVEEASE